MKCYHMYYIDQIKFIIIIIYDLGSELWEGKFDRLLIIAWLK